MPYKEVRVEQKIPNGYRTITRREWFDIPKKHTIATMLGMGDIAKRVADEPICYEYKGRIYEDIPSNMINEIDEALWNNNKEYVNRAYTMIKKARERIETIENEITATEQKGKHIMMHNSFKSIYSELKGIYADSQKACKGIFEEWEEAKKAWDKVRISEGVDEKTKMLAKSDYIRAEEKFKLAHGEVAEQTKQRVTELRKVLEEAVQDHYRIKPGKVDNVTLELLRLGVLKDSDIERIAQENMGNNTMLAVIKKYAEERPRSNEMLALVNKITECLESEKEINTFDALCRYGERSYGVDKNRRIIFEDVFDKMFDDAIADAPEITFDTVSETESSEAQ